MVKCWKSWRNVSTWDNSQSQSESRVDVLRIINALVCIRESRNDERHTSATRKEGALPVPIDKATTWVSSSTLKENFHLPREPQQQATKTSGVALASRQKERTGDILSQIVKGGWTGDAKETWRSCQGAPITNGIRAQEESSEEVWRQSTVQGAWWSGDCTLRNNIMRDGWRAFPPIEFNLVILDMTTHKTSLISLLAAISVRPGRRVA